MGMSRWMSRKNDGGAARLMGGDDAIVRHFDVASTMHTDGPAGYIEAYNVGGRQFRFHVDRFPRPVHVELVP